MTIDLSRILNPLPDASHTRNRETSPPDSQCLAGTRHDVFQHLGLWMRSTGEIWQYSQARKVFPKPICWMYGSFGCGKSAIAQSMAEWYADHKRLAASFFFFRGAGSRSTTHGFAATLPHQIAMNVPGARKHIERAIRQDRRAADPTRSMQSQLRSLVYGPLYDAMVEGCFAPDDPFLVVVDGMDECEDKQGISAFIDCSVDFFSRYPFFPLRLFITSRVEEHIQTHIEDGVAAIYLFDLSSRPSREDLEYAMSVTFMNARKRSKALRSLGHSWPAPNDLDVLLNYCDGSFIFMSTIARFILWGLGKEDRRNPKERLRLALRINPGIDGVYQDILSRSRDLPHFVNVISTLVYLQAPLSTAALAALLGIETYDVVRVLAPLQAILQIPGRDDQPVTFFHTSLRDFLADEARSGQFYAPPSHHTYLMHRCLDVLIGTEPTANAETCLYIMKYWQRHMDAAEKIDNLRIELREPYNPIDAGEWKRRSVQREGGSQRPVKFIVTTRDMDDAKFWGLEDSVRPSNSRNSSM